MDSRDAGRPSDIRQIYLFNEIDPTHEALKELRGNIDCNPLYCEDPKLVIANEVSRFLLPNNDIYRLNEALEERAGSCSATGQLFYLIASERGEKTTPAIIVSDKGPDHVVFLNGNDTYIDVDNGKGRREDLGDQDGEVLVISGYDLPSVIWTTEAIAHYFSNPADPAREAERLLEVKNRIERVLMLNSTCQYSQRRLQDVENELRKLERNTPPDGLEKVTRESHGLTMSVDQLVK